MSNTLKQGTTYFSRGRKSFSWGALPPCAPPGYGPANKHSNIVEQINWVLSELSVVVHKTVNRIGRTCISLLGRTHRYSCIL